MWLSKEDISQKAYHYCKYIKDDPEVRKHIIDSGYAYQYCIYVKDDPEIRKYITNKEDLRQLKEIRNYDVVK